jgi:hypothetical protein
VNVQPIILSVPTYLPTPAATYAFFTSEYKSPQQERAIEVDVVINQNGRFKWLYDNGPGFRKWAPFNVRCEDALQRYLGLSATQQYNNLLHAWNYRGGPLGLKTPEGVFSVHWAQGELEVQRRQFPLEPNTPAEFTVVVQFEEAS